ncbi:hypothetical protein GCM10012275_34230 [Longimycelium tulufanense]|uniref:Aminoglycoside phosphotransferase domain-containing protein n=1 Tax=Longimycelium tulufanense TaxID=907463 RepID=A0A8J3CG25_9PSEU|nr:aminoglycoside phosphotransferase family protein [Longimycelium tulufanense]GGM60223.1 hypothetical protein GCM10012275_34230 [Longimycelium tulufanense]
MPDHVRTLRTLPSTETVSWVCRSLGGARILASEFLPGGNSHANHALLVDGPVPYQVVLRRWVRPGWWVADPDFTVEREVAALALLERADVPAPRVIAADPTGEHGDAPALLMTRLPGSSPDGRTACSPEFLPRLALAAAAIHRITRPWPGIPDYRPYNDLHHPCPPARSSRAWLWERAFTALAGTAPAGQEAFVHRDFHPDNTLWQGARLTGVVDWTTASRGVAGVDLGHMRWNLVLDRGERHADQFLTHYARVSEVDLGCQAYWDVRTVVDLLPDDGLTVAELALLEPYLARCLAEL